MTIEPSRKILVVDDEPVNLELMGEILETRYELIFATNGSAALEAARDHRPGLVLLDIMMPGMDGYEVCRRLKADPELSKIPVIFVTARGEVRDEARGFDAGAVDYIQKPVSMPIVLRRVNTHLALVRTEELEEMSRSAIYMLGEAGHYNDTDTGVHIWRMAAYAGALARAAGWPGPEREILELAAPMHDTGKIGIPDAILKAPRKLTLKEWEIMKTHSRIGCDILGKSDRYLFKKAAEVALAHHEKWDGTGYPGSLTGEAIPESARIVAIADVFDALTMKRPYKQAWPVREAMAEIQRCAGTQFDPRLTGLFLSMEPQIRTIKQKWDTRENG